ncbi:hypothetical protein F5888DRAFT_1865451 [Russula emetica]|nr:hypothetical protein F5888DRAFT_1865451 [Russula emetica]
MARGSKIHPDVRLGLQQKLHNDLPLPPPRAPGIDGEALNRIHEVLDGVKAQTDDLHDGQLWTSNVLDELRQRCPPDNTELVERLQRLEDLINRLGEAQRHPRAPTPVESLFDSGSDISSTIRRLRERWDGLRQEPQTLLAPTPVRPRTSLDDMMAELLRPPQPPGPPQIQPPPAFIPLTYRPDARGLRPRSASPTLLTEIPPIRPHTLHPPPVTTCDVGSRPRPDDSGPFLDGLHRARRQRPSAAPDGWIDSTREAEPAPPPPPPHDYQDPGRGGRATAPAVMYIPQPPPGPSVPGAVPQFAQPGVVPPMPPPFTQVQTSGTTMNFTNTGTSRPTSVASSREGRVTPSHSSGRITPSNSTRYTPYSNGRVTPASATRVFSDAVTPSARSRIKSTATSMNGTKRSSSRGLEPTSPTGQSGSRTPVIGSPTRFNGPISPSTGSMISNLGSPLKTPKSGTGGRGSGVGVGLPSTTPTKSRTPLLTPKQRVPSAVAMPPPPPPASAPSFTRTVSLNDYPSDSESLHDATSDLRSNGRAIQDKIASLLSTRKSLPAEIDASFVTPALSDPDGGTLLHDRVAELEAENQRLNILISGLQGEELEHGRRTNNMRGDRDQALARVAELEASVKSVERNLHDRDLKIEVFGRSLSNASADTDKARAEGEARVRDLQSLLDDKDALLSSLKESLALKEGSETETHTVIIAKDAEINLLETRVKKAYAELEDERRELGNQVDALRHAGQETIALYEERLSTAEARRYEMEDLIGSLREQLRSQAQSPSPTSAARQLSSATQIENEALREQVVHLQKKLTITEDMLEEVHATAERDASFLPIWAQRPAPGEHRNASPSIPASCPHGCLQVFSCGEDKPQYTRLKDSSSQNPVGNPYHDTSTLSDKLRSALKTQLLTSTTPIPTLTTATSTTGATHPSTATASQPTTQPTTTMTTSSPQVQSDTSPPSSHDSKRYDYTSERKKFDKRARGAQGLDWVKALIAPDELLIPALLFIGVERIHPCTRHKTPQSISGRDKVQDGSGSAVHKVQELTRLKVHEALGCGTTITSEAVEKAKKEK